MEPGLEELKSTYSKLSDSKIVQLASSEAATLRPEAIRLLMQEINRRGLDKNILKGIYVQLKKVTETELKYYCEIIRNLPCPLCGSEGVKLNGTITDMVYSMILFTNREKQVIIACPECLDSENTRASIISSVFGWWSFWGIFKTISAIRFNNKMEKQNHYNEANQILRDFVYNNIGKIEISKNDPSDLLLLIQKQNS